jgi:hypothetical protein
MDYDYLEQLILHVFDQYQICLTEHEVLFHLKSILSYFMRETCGTIKQYVCHARRNIPNSFDISHDVAACHMNIAHGKNNTNFFPSSLLMNKRICKVESFQLPSVHHYKQTSVSLTFIFVYFSVRQLEIQINYDRWKSSPDSNWNPKRVCSEVSP